MAKGTQIKRLMWLALLLSLAFAGLGYRLVDLQVLQHEELGSLAQKQTEQWVLFEPRRGDIVDIKGHPLATSVMVKRVCANPEFIGNRQAEIARILAPLLADSEVHLAERMQPKLETRPNGQVGTNRYVVLKEKVPVKTWDLIRSNMLEASFGFPKTNLTKKDKATLRMLRASITAENDQERIYPSKTLASHIIGFTGVKDTEVDGRPVKEIVGKDGIESTFNNKLTGTRGWRLTEVDVGRRELVRNREQDVEPTDGLNVVLTVDSVVQQIVEEALADAMEKHTPISASGIVVRPRTGEILAMATNPTFDPNDRKGATGNLRNRIITDFAEPGSTFKIVVVSGALNEGVVKPTERFDCENGHFFFAGRTLHDDHPHPVLSVEEIITKSSNIGAAKIGIKMGPNKLSEYIRDFGFGKSTGIPLPGEVSAGDYVRPVDRWSKVSIAQIPMGHGICVTRLQMTMAMCAIANKGCLMKPMLVDRLEDRDHNVVAKYSPTRVRQVISESTAAMMVKALKTVTTAEGTAPKAALEHYSVAGKTGTALKVENGVYVRKYFSSFVGFFPADNPEVCISITLDEPKQGHYGGMTAAPVFKQIAERLANYLNIRPEDEGVPGLTDPATVAPEARTLKVSLRTGSEHK